MHLLRRSALGPVLALALAACSTTAHYPDLPPLERRSVPELDYAAHLSGAGLALDEAPDEPPAPAARADEALVGIACVVLSVDAHTGDELLGATGARAFATSTVDAAALVEACRARDDASLLRSPKLILRDGEPGTVAVVNQVAYVSGFRLVQREDATVADPVVDVLTDGLVLGASASAVPDTDRVALDVELELADVLTPLREHELALAGDLGTLTLQEPAIARQRLATGLELGADGCLVLIAEDLERPGRVLLALVAARRLTPDELDVHRTRELGERVEGLFALPG